MAANPNPSAHRHAPAASRPRPRRGADWALALVLLALSGGFQALAAQAGRVQAIGADSITRRIQSIEPRSGPPGTRVTVASGLMPHITPVRIGIGGTRSGFEAIAELLTSGMGEFSVDVEVPDWVRWDRTHRFIVFDFYFNPIALSEAFIVTDEAGRVRREGEVVDGGHPCTTLRDVDGQVFTLVGVPEALAAPGGRITLEGTLGGDDVCGHYPTIRVTEARPAPGAGR